MGWMCSWVGVQGATRSAVLARLGFEETGPAVIPGVRDAAFSAGDVGDWIIVFSETFDWGSPEQALSLSDLGLTVSLQFEDKVEMTSVACGARDGVELWRVSHVNDVGRELVAAGEMPPEFDDIRDRLMREQAGDDGSCDYLHDIPIEVAKSVTGYRTDDWEPPFAALKRIGEAAEPAREPGGGLFAMLRGIFGGSGR